MCCAHALAFFVTLACSRLLCTTCSNYLPSLSLHSHVWYFCTAICPLCNMPASSPLLMQVGAFAMIGVLSWTCELLPPQRRCSLHPSCGCILPLGPLPRPGSWHIDNPTTNLAGMANSIGCLGLQLVSSASCQVFYLERPCNVLCTSGHSPPRLFALRVWCALYTKHLDVCCCTCLPPSHTHALCQTCPPRQPYFPPGLALGPPGQAHGRPHIGC